MTDGITITGGYTQAETDSFRTAAERLRQAQLAAEAARSRAHAAQAVLAVGSMPTMPTGPAAGMVDAACRRAHTEVTAAAGVLGTLAGHWGALRAAVLRAGHLYEQSEDAVGLLMRFAPQWGLPLAVAEGAGGVLGALRGGHGADAMSAFAGLGDHTQDATAGLGLLLTWPLPLPWHDRVPVGAAMVGGLDAGLAGAGALFGHGPGATYSLSVEHRTTAPDGSALTSLPVPRTAEQALRQVHDVSGAAGPGTVAVQRVGDGPGARWVVTIPGTQTYSPSSTNPLDGRTDTALVAGAPNDAEAEVVAAMRDAGVPQGATVVLVGHSLGGIAAARLAADRRFQQQYAVRGVITAGSPIGGIHVPSSTTVLSVENSSEGVSGMEGTNDPASANQVTVHGELSPETLGAAQTDGENPHDVRLHADVLARARASGDPALDRALDRIDRLLGADDPGAPTTTSYFTGERH